jgi:antitoxin MazE
MFMKTTLSKWGNSVAVRIPSKILDSLSLGAESDISVSVQGNKIILSPVENKIKLIPLKKLLKGFDKKQKINEDIWGKPMGKEIW